MSGNLIGKRFARPLAACAISAACGLAILLEAADVHAEGHQLEIVAEAAPGADTSRRFVLLSLSQEGAVEDPVRERAIAYIRRGLVVAEFVAVQSLAEADVAIAFSYGIGGPEFQPSSTSWRTLVSSAGYATTDTSMIDAQAYANALLSSSAAPLVSVTLPSTPIPDNVILPAYPVAAPTPAAIPMSTPAPTRTLPGTYPVFLELVAYDLQAYRDADRSVQLWRTVVYVLTSDADVDELLPAMLAGARKYFGADHDERRFTTVQGASRFARYIRGETP